MIRAAGRAVRRLRHAWSTAWRDPAFRRSVAITVPALVAAIVSYRYFLAYNETRTGMAFEDPVFALFRPRDVSGLTFTLTYSATILGIACLLWTPRTLVMGLQTYVLVSFARMLSLYLVPLEPAATRIRLVDPFVKHVIGSEGTPERDLFFSGHVSTVFIFFLMTKRPLGKALFLAAATAVGLCLMLQHVHYTIDVVVAPVITYALHRVVRAGQPLFGPVRADDTP